MIEDRRCAHTSCKLIAFSLVFLEIQINFNRHDRTRVYWIFERVLIMHAVSVFVKLDFFRFSLFATTNSGDFVAVRARNILFSFIWKIDKKRGGEIEREREMAWISMKCKSGRFIKIQFENWLQQSATLWFRSVWQSASTAHNFDSFEFRSNFVQSNGSNVSSLSVGWCQLHMKPEEKFETFCV